MKDIKVLSLFDGISCGMVALNRLGINVTKYDAYEIDKNAVKVSEDNWPNIVHKGDVFKAEYKKGEYDLLIGGSPCTYWSIARGGKGRETTSSGLGWDLFSQYVRALKEVQPKYFLYENNFSMSEDIKNEITKSLGCEPIMINSADFSAQNRKRLYWTNIPLKERPLPIKDTINDILYTATKNVITEIPVKYQSSVRISKNNTCISWDTSGKGYYSMGSRARKNDKMGTVTTGGSGLNLWIDGNKFRKLDIIEIERLQTLPDNYTKVLNSISSRIHGVGNGWTVKVIEYLMCGLLDI